MFSHSLQERLKLAITVLPLDSQRIQRLLSDIHNRLIPNNDYLHVIGFIELLVIDRHIGRQIESISKVSNPEDAMRWEVLKNLYQEEDSNSTDVIEKWEVLNYLFNGKIVFEKRQNESQTWQPLISLYKDCLSHYLNQASAEKARLKLLTETNKIFEHVLNRSIKYHIELNLRNRHVLNHSGQSNL